MILEIEVTFPAGRFHGEEWPPAPARLFQALVAGTHLGAHGLINRTARDGALRWLESQPAPSILAGPASGSGYHLTNWVPNNDDEFFPPGNIREKRADKNLGHHAFPTGSVVSYRWELPVANGGDEHAEVVAAMASLVTHLGQTTDSVFTRGWTLAEIPLSEPADSRTLHLPRETPGGRWRAPAPGFFDLLQRRYPRSVSSEPPDFSNSRQVDYAPAGTAPEVPPAPMAIFELLRPDGERPLRFDPRDVRQPAGMVRGALLEWAKRPAVQRAFGAGLLARLLAGHRGEGDAQPADDNGHFGIVPLPTLKHDGPTDGKMGRVALVGWGTADALSRELFEEAARGLHGAELRDGGAPFGTLRGAVGNAGGHWQRFWTEPARCWRSVTPVVLPGFLRAGRSPEALLGRALGQAGYQPETVQSVATFRGPLIPHTLPPMAYRLREDYLDRPPRFHAEVIFRRPVTGPLVLGRGRYVGLGLFVPLPS